MEEAMNKFETLVGSAEQKLDNIEKKLDLEFSKHLSSDDADGDVEDHESLLKKLEEVKQEYRSLCSEAGEVSKAQREMAERFQQELLVQVKQLQLLQDKGLIGSESRPTNEAESAVNNLARKADGEESLLQTSN